MNRIRIKSHYLEGFIHSKKGADWHVLLIPIFA